jgi:glucoamylase
MMPEQVWDTDDIPARELFRGRPSGSAMPLVWAHAEHIKLCRSLADGAVFDMPPQTVARYIEAASPPRCAVWRENLPIATIPAGRVLRIDLREPARVHWSADGWRSTFDSDTQDTGTGLHVLEIPTDRLSPGAGIAFTWFRLAGQSWAGRDYSVAIVEPAEAWATEAAAAGD